MSKYLLLTAVFCLTALVCGAQEPDSGVPATGSAPEIEVVGQPALTLEQIMAKPFSANLKKVEVSELLRSLARIGPLNIVATKSVGGQLTFLLENVTLGDALEIVLITNGLAKEIKGNIIHIMTEAEYQALFGKPYNTRLAVKTYQMQFVLPSRVASFLENIKSRNVSSQIIPDNGTRTLVIIEVQDKIKEMEEIIRRLDLPPETLTFELKNASVDDITPLVTALLTPNYGDIKTDKRTKRFIVTDHGSVLESITRLIYDFDGKPRQVLIEAKVIQISLTDDFNMGVNWTQVFSSFSKLKDFKFEGNFPVIADKAKTINLTSTVGTFPQGNYKYVIQALQDFGDNKLISAPRLLTISDKKSEFHIGSTVRYPKTTQTTASGGAATLSETFEEIKEGVTLNIMAAINADRYITMEILPKITKVVKWEQTGLGNPFPSVIEEGTTTTNVMVKDGVTIVIAGLIKDEKQVTYAGMPIISQIPLLGKLLSSKRDYVVKSETVIFMTPYIITGDADSSVITRQYDFERKEPKELKPIR
jgi:type II secretory pathway component GspD/PulD (secretin)